MRPRLSARRRNNARRTLACRTCRLVVPKADHAERTADWHTPGHPEHDCDGTVEAFDSKLEAETWLCLCDALASGHLVDVRRQVRYPIHVAGGASVGTYVADFVIVQKQYDADGKGWYPIERIIDSKGIRRDRNGRQVGIDTPLSKFKRKCVEAEYGVRVELWPTAGGEL